VAESYAIQAGREIRIIVKPEQIDDLAALQLSKDVAKTVEENLQYPGQIKITVIRETRAVDFAKYAGEIEIERAAIAMAARSGERPRPGAVSPAGQFDHLPCGAGARGAWTGRAGRGRGKGDHPLPATTRARQRPAVGPAPGLPSPSANHCLSQKAGEKNDSGRLRLVAL